VTLLAVVGVSLSAGAASADPPEDFVDDTLVLSGLNYPTNVEFAPDGRVFVAEKRGTIQVYDSIDDPTPTLFHDLRPAVHDHWDRGLLGLALHPNFPTAPYVYALYTYAVPLDPSMPTWPGSQCDDPNGGTVDGCVVSGRLSRLTASGSQPTLETVLVNDWCQQYPSHSIGDLVFGDDGALYVSGGDGASFGWVDYGQGGGSYLGTPTPANPCGDPPVGVGGDQTSPTAQGGALRSQDLRTPGDPVTLDGTVIRIDPMTGDPLPDNPSFGASDENEERIVAYGLRNPFRMTVQPGTGDLFVGDVGWGTWEEVNVHGDPTGEVLNFGWPCYEGGSDESIRQVGYDNADLTLCENLYGAPGSVEPSLFAYDHDNDITGTDDCPPAPPPQPTSSSISGLAFYEGGAYPGSYDGALFGSDYSRNCIWVMLTDASGLDPATTTVFHDSAAHPVELETGPAGDLYYVDIGNHKIHRIRYRPPIAVIEVDQESGSAPLVSFDGSQSIDTGGGDIELYEWDFDGDGVYDASGVTSDHTYDEQGAYRAVLRVTDGDGDTDTESVTIQVLNSAPTATISSPQATLTWAVGDTIAFSGSGTDPEDGELLASSMTWELVLQHCATLQSCHEHVVTTFPDTASGSFSAPDHEYPSYLELRLIVEDQYGWETSESVDLDPETVDLTFVSNPAGLDITFLDETETAPFTKTWIVGATVDVSTAQVQQHQGSDWTFQSWSNGGERSQTFPAPASDATYTATFGLNNPPVANAGPNRSVSVGQLATLDGTGSSDPDGDPLSYSWSILSRPGGSSASLVGANTSQPKLTPDMAGTYKVMLQVNDGIDTASDQVLVLASEVQSSSGDIFVDDNTSIFESSIEWMAAKGITKGCNPPKNDRFCPDDFVTRGQMAAFFARAFGWSDDGGGNLFTDDDNSTFNQSIDLMATAGVTKGCNPPKNDRFCPGDLVTRAQMAAFFARAFGWSDDGGGNVFVDDNSSTFEHDIDLMGTAGVTKGCNPPSNDRFCPDDFVTRGQMAAFFERAWKTAGLP
jgi:glucose/arabinose dehydrogenase